MSVMNEILKGIFHIDSGAIKYLNQYLNECKHCKKQPIFTYEPLSKWVFIECPCEKKECRSMYFDLNNVVFGLFKDFLINDFIKRWNTRTGEK